MSGLNFKICVWIIVRSLISSIYLTFFFSCVLYGVSTNDSWHPSLSFKASIKWQSRVGCVSTISQQSVHVRSLLCQRLSAISLTLAQYWIFALQRHSGQHLFVHILWSWKCWSSGDQLSVYWVSAVYLTIIFLEPKWACLWVNNSWGQRPNGLSTQRPIKTERNNCFSKIQLVGKEYWDKTTLASKTRFSRHCFGFQSRRFSLLVGYNIWPSSGSINQNTANNW